MTREEILALPRTCAELLGIDISATRMKAICPPQVVRGEPGEAADWEDEGEQGDRPEAAFF
jgi:hypothetical protein